MKLSKQLGSVVIAIAILVSSMGAFACGRDQFIAYDQIPDALGNYAKLYFCPEKDTVVAKGIAQTAEWKPVFFEAEYPHREIEALFLDGINTGMTRYVGKNAEVNTKEVPEFWEAKVPYFVFNRIYSDFTGTFQPTNTLKTNFKSAPVAKEWNNKGFGRYVIENGVAKDYTKVYEEFANAGQAQIDLDKIDRLAEQYYAAIENGVDYEEASKIFVKSINNVSWLKLTGPDYVTGGEMVVEPMAKIAAGADADWYDTVLAVDTPATNDVPYLNVDYQDEYTADIEWVTVGFELKAPYRIYQVLSVNGILMDGSFVEKVGETETVVEKAGEVEEYKTAIQLVKKGTDLVNSTTTIEKDYVVNPYELYEYTTVTEDKTYKVSDDPMREQIIGQLATLHGAEYEVRIVEYKEKPAMSKLPYIYRYQGYAQPNVEWKTAFAEKAYPYEIYEEKFVNGIATGEYRTTGKFAEPKVTLEAGMSQPRTLTVMLQDTTDSSKVEWELKNEGFMYYKAGNRIVVFVPDEVIYEGHSEVEVKINNIIKEATKVVNVEVVE
ncbi:MAG: hypothetical protein IKV86_01225 [Clostridia bacterium]|nr:hypothetical protein [Clostridia bacterium]